MAKAAARTTSGRKTLFSKAFQRYLVSKEYLSPQQAADIETTLMTMENPIGLTTYLLENDYISEEMLADLLPDHGHLPGPPRFHHQPQAGNLEAVDEET